MWFFYGPNIVYGEYALNFLENIKGDKCFIVTDKNLEELGYVKILTDKLDQYGKKYEIFADVQPEPHEEDVLKGKERCNAYAPNLIIALGGGSVIDSAKAIWGMYEFPEMVIDDLYPTNVQLYDFGNKAKMVAIPTTSGTGAETTWAIVISRFTNNVWRKLTQAHRNLIPTYAIVDPIFPVGMPPKLTAGTGFDALAHSIEGIASGWRNEFSDAMGLKAIELVFKYLPIAYKDPKNMEARDYLHQAASMAGLCFGNSQAHIGHSCGHALSAVFHIHHGIAVGLMLPYVSQYCMLNPDENDKTFEIYAKLAKQLNWVKWADDNKKAANIVIDKIKELAKEVDFPIKIQDLGISREDLDKNLDVLISLCFQDGCTSMSPRGVLQSDLENLYKYAYEGKDIDF